MINKTLLIWLLTAVLGSAFTIMVMNSNGQVAGAEIGQTYFLLLIFSGLFSLPAIPVLLANFYLFKKLDDSLPKIALLLTSVTLANAFSIAGFYILFELSYELFSMLISYTFTSYVISFMISWRKITMTQQFEDYLKETSSIKE